MRIADYGFGDVEILFGNKNTEINKKPQNKIVS